VKFKTLGTKVPHLNLKKIKHQFFFFFLRNRLTVKHTHTHLITLSHQAQTHYLDHQLHSQKWIIKLLGL